MKRRLFLKNTGVCTLGICVLPVNFTHQLTEFSILELMGKVDIQLFGEDINLREEAYHAFLDMRDAARKDGIEIKIVSSFRNFDRQKAIFERKYERFTEEGLEPLAAIDKIIEYSTIPGTSRHHWGTDIDIIDGNAPAEGDVLVQR
ncbi:MAG: M15 family metallopeptidase, partial [Flavobacteriaceae bacterium]|nr:M15 family metallopeptidase [Flavobacteriaceae bacterium]